MVRDTRFKRGDNQRAPQGQIDMRWKGGKAGEDWRQASPSPANSLLAHPGWVQSAKIHNPTPPMNSKDIVLIAATRLIRLVRGTGWRNRGGRFEGEPRAEPACRGFLEFLRCPSFRPRALSARLGPDTAIPLPAWALVRSKNSCGLAIVEFQETCEALVSLDWACGFADTVFRRWKQ